MSAKKTAISASLTHHAGTRSRSDLDEIWEERYAELAMVTVQRGRPVPQMATSRSLVFWVALQRKIWRAGRLPPSRQAKLAALGLRLEPRADAWEESLHRFAEFQENHHQWGVAYIKQFDRKLANWVNHQKAYLRIGQLPPDRVAVLTAMGLAPAKKAVRGSRTEIEMRHAGLLQELGEYFAQHGHLKIPSSPDPQSLFRRLLPMKNRALHEPDGWMHWELKRLGAFDDYENWEWENQFAAWRRYTAATGDYACAVNPPADVAAWDAEVRAKFFLQPGDPLTNRDRHTVPLLQGRQRAKVGSRPMPKAKFRQILETLSFLDRVRGRLLRAGFVVSCPRMDADSLLAAKLGRLGGLPPVSGMPLRVVISALSALKRAGRLAESAEGELRRYGFFWHQRTRRWRRAQDAHRVVGSVTITPAATPKAPLQAPLVHLHAALAPRDAQEKRGNDVGLREALKIVFSAKESPLTLKELYAIRSIRKLAEAARYRPDMDARITLRLAIWSLCDRRCLVVNVAPGNEEDFLVFQPGPNPDWARIDLL